MEMVPFSIHRVIFTFFYDDDNLLISRKCFVNSVLFRHSWQMRLNKTQNLYIMHEQKE